MLGDGEHGKFVGISMLKTYFKVIINKNTETCWS